MTRLADYFVIIGYDHEKEVVNGQGYGKIIQRFPENDWPDCPFTQGLELFCQASGWRLLEQKQEPTFIVSVLTDINAVRHYCACLTFSEDVDQTNITHQQNISNTHREDDDDDLESLESTSGIIRCATLYAPKSIVLISTLDCFNVFRNCLGIIYAAYVDNINTSFERLIGNILGHVQVPPPGGAQIRFSIGAGDRQCIQPVAYLTVPSTRTSVALLFQQLGIANSLTLFCAAICDQKVLFHSKSYSHLTEASHALTALMYPLKYSYVYIPILPLGLIEVLSTPTPFIAGVHESIKPELSELLDVVIADLDEGSLRIPENTHIPLMPQPILSRVQHCLQMVLRPELSTVDLAFFTSTSIPKVANLEMQDKEIRAIFLRFFAELFESYRSYLTLVRINPEPVISFHKAMFLGNYGLLENDFAKRVLDSMSFNTFVQERGPPYRICDIFDEVFASMQDMLKCEQANRERLMHNINDLANQLFQNENGTGQPFVQKIPWPTEGAHLRLHQPLFPSIDSSKITEIIEEGLLKHRLRAKIQPATTWQQHPRIIPCANCSTVARDKTYLFSMNVRRLEVLRNCVTFIFDNHISDARKIFPAVLRSLKSPISRMALVEELSFHVNSNRALIDNQQFDLVVRLLNSALQNDSPMDENGIAAAILPLATAFCRKLNTGVIQFAYTCVQDHAVWSNLQYWEAAFNQDVQHQICQLYLPNPLEKHDNIKEANHNRLNTLSVSNGDNRRLSTASYNSINSRQKSLSALEIAAEQMRLWPGYSEEQRMELIKNEESTVYSQAIHYANRIVYLRIPLDASKKFKEHAVGLEGESLSSMITNSIAESDSFDAESGFEDQEVNEVGTIVAKFVTRFVDKVCTDSGVTTEHIKALHQMIPGVIAMHLESLDSVLQEIKRLPPIQKPKISFPSLVAGEEIVLDGMRAYLIPDGREEGAGGNMGGPALLPAEGAIFLTTYRVIFKGNPCDPLACEQYICRSFPVSSLTREKKMPAQYFHHIDHNLQEVIQLRSSTFQMLKVAFDDEVSSEDVEMMRKLLLRLRNPVSIQMTFAFQGGQLSNRPLHLMTKNKEKNASLRSFAKKTLIKTARKAGIKAKDSSKRGTFIQPTPPLNRKYLSADHYIASTMPVEPQPMFADDLSVIDEHEIKSQIIFDAKNIDRLSERSYVKDLVRVGLGMLKSTSAIHSRSKIDTFCLSLLNINQSYSVCSSYPAVLAVPQNLSDDSIQKFARSHRHNRFPTATWRHPINKAVLLRGGGFHAKGVMGMIKGHYTAPSGRESMDGGATTSVTVEQEKYFSAILTATPSASENKLRLQMLGNDGVHHLANNSGQHKSVSSLFNMGGSSKDHLYGSNNALCRSSIRQSSKDKRPTSVIQARSMESPNVGRKVMDSPAASINSEYNLGKAALYIFGEKTQVKGIKTESFGGKCEFVAVDYPEVRNVKSSFKKLQRACVASGVPPHYSESTNINSNTMSSTMNLEGKKRFFASIQDSGWLTQIESILQIASAIADLMDAHASSIAICLEDGWDFTAQVSSVSQILLDPYYRTIEGFRILIEKEWLAFGHRFGHRGNQTSADQVSGFAPIFLQFLDAVHQVQNQFPTYFEFNEYYLKYLAFHHVSNRFRTFLLNSELNRLENGWLPDEISPFKLLNMDKDSQSTLNSNSDTLTAPGYRLIASSISIWDYITQYHSKYPIFYNFRYNPSNRQSVLRPLFNISSLQFWDYYLTEDLSTGTPYDLELLEDVFKIGEDPTDQTLIHRQPRLIINGCYDNIMLSQPSSCFGMLRELYNYTQDGGQQLSWMQLWESVHLVSPNMTIPNHSKSENSNLQQMSKRLCDVSSHKRSTLELLLKSRIIATDSMLTRGAILDKNMDGNAIMNQHSFQNHTYYSMPISCDYCSHILWGLIKTGLQCRNCGFNCHEKCLAYVPKNCAQDHFSSEMSNISQSINFNSVHNTSNPSGMTNTMVHSLDNKDAFLDFPSLNLTNEIRTHEGYLHKRGALLKGWKQRWFVLDSLKHQLRYYESDEDTICKGCVDLAEVVNVASIKNVPGAPKKADELAFFELKTTRRNYQFYANDLKSAQDWIDKIQICI